MRTMSAKDAKNHFGELLMEAQRAPVTIEKNGKPVAVLLSFDEHEQNERLRLDRLRGMVAEADAAAALGQVSLWTDEMTEEIVAEGKGLLEHDGRRGAR